MKRAELVTYLDNYLDIGHIQDYGPQGLQVETDNETINKIALAVDVSPAIITAAVDWSADMLLVHHGVLWRLVEPIAGPLGHRVRLMMRHGLNLYAAHLALDAHDEVGNNVILAQMLGVSVDERWADVNGTPLGVLGAARAGMTRQAVVAQVEEMLDTTVHLLPHGPERVERVAILSGFGADKIAEVAALGADTYVTGETSHANYWAAADVGLNVIYAGHYATETVGVQALGRHLTEKFGLTVQFFDFPTGM